MTNYGKKQTDMKLTDKESLQYIVDMIRDFAFDVYNKYDANDLMGLLEDIKGDLRVNSVADIISKLKYFGVKKHEIAAIAGMLEQPEQDMFILIAEKGNRFL